MITKDEKIVQLRQWAIEQAVKAGSQPGAVTYHADSYLAYALSDLAEAPE